MIDRRTFLAGTGAVVLAVPLTAGAQPAKKVWRIGYLSAGSPPPNLAKGPFRQGFHDLGYVEGRDFVMEYRFAEGHSERLPDLAADLVRARVVFLYDPTTLPGDSLGASLKLMHAGAETLNVVLQPVAVSDPNGIAQAFAEFGRGTNGLVIETASVLLMSADQIGRLALQRRLPAGGHGRTFADAGCLMSYGENQADMFRRAAVFVDKILKGAKPGDLPIEQPSKFELVINLKTAKALSLTIPPSLLGRADEVIHP